MGLLFSPPTLRRSCEGLLGQAADRFRERRLVILILCPRLDSLPRFRRHAQSDHRVFAGGRPSPLWPAILQAIPACCNGPCPHPLVRMTWISKSRIFLRSVLRLTPSRSAARIWLPRVAASAAESKGYSISRRIR